jgi:hypothetical protein
MPSFRVPFFKLCFLFTPFVPFPQIANANTIVSVQGDVNFYSTFQSGLPPEPIALEVSWSQTNTYGDVSIFADLNGFGGSGAGIAYLTTALGPGTTAANEAAAPDNFTFPNSQQDVQLFSGLNLGPGTYYLTVYGTGGWGLSQNPSTTTVTEDTGAALGQPYDSDDLTFPTFIPAADYATPIACCLVFAVDGTPVPEPNLQWPIGFAGLALVCWKLYRRGFIKSL